ncbi:glycoside hydrolase family 13 protein [Thermobifida halotolerans]|uniref:Glycoside hydrolase family 13 protein n=1 Tax=Thermobifida halotolerans TaxID=483545 RepID=A0AA97M190_9ACTN|nr:glycoside hydrolase family 13 protein [Thermobifida halotolerans]UOE21555.1 glycoside hydrolase family 13 protein [Thermobifida halotolerans]
MRQDWWHDAVIYQIYPRSFADSDGDGVGDLPGITRRLHHVAELGADAVWLSPFYPSPLADGGYDVADFRGVDPRLGTLEDFDALVTTADRLGLRVIVDIVPNHTSDRHEWFQRALAAPPGSPERNRYIFRDGRGPDGSLPPSNWQSMFGGPAWTRVADGQWYLHLFAREQPDLNWFSSEVRAEFTDILRFWCRRGVDGFRIDVANALVKDLSEPLREVVPHDDPTGVDPFTTNPDHPHWDRPEVHDIYREWRRVLDEFDPPRIAVAEAWLPSERLVRYLRSDELHQAFNFEFLRCPWNAAAYRRVISTSLADAASVDTRATWVLANHDVVRPVSLLGLPKGTDLNAWLLSDGADPKADLALGRRRARAAALLELALPGSAYLYQGEELGLPEVADLPADVLQDPTWERSGHTGKGRDGCRVPIPWERTGPSFGFGPAPGWLPQPDDWGEMSVEAQRDDPASFLTLYRTALRLRRGFSPDPGFSWDAEFDRGDVLAFRRGTDLLVLVNTGSEPVPLPRGQVLLASADLRPHVLPGNTAVWLRTTVAD